MFVIKPLISCIKYTPHGNMHICYLRSECDMLLEIWKSFSGTRGVACLQSSLMVPANYKLWFWLNFSWSEQSKIMMANKYSKKKRVKFTLGNDTW